MASSPASVRGAKQSNASSSRERTYRLIARGGPAFFLLLWFVGAEQYAFVLFGVPLALLVSRSGRIRVLGLAVAALLLAALGGLAIAWSPYSGDAIRTFTVWFSLALVSFLAAVDDDNVTNGLILALWRIYVLGFVAYVAALVVPVLSEAVLAVKLDLGVATAIRFTSSTLIFGQEVARPHGLLLYSNEYALAGLLIGGLMISRGLLRRPSIAVLLPIVTAVGSTSRTLIITFLGAVLVFLLLRLTGEGTDAFPRVLAAVAVGLSCVYAGVVFGDALPVVNTDSLLQARYGASDELRQLSYRRGLELFRDSPWSGVGGLPTYGAIQIGSHSMFTSLAVRHGVLGLLLLAAVLALLFRACVYGLLSQRRGEAWLGAMLLVGIMSSATIQWDDDVVTASTLFTAGVVLSRQKTQRMREVTRV